MATSASQNFFKANGVLQLLPDIPENNKRWQVATPEEVQAEIQRIQSPTPVSGNLNFMQGNPWAKEYLTNLQTGLNNSPYAYDDKGVLTTKTALASQQAQQQAIASGSVYNAGTANAPLTMPYGSPGATLQMSPKAYAAGFGGAGVPGYDSTIPTETLKTQTKPDIPTAPTSNTADLMAAGATEESKKTTAAQTEQSKTQKSYDTLSDEISSLLDTTVGRGQAQLDAEQKANVPGLQQELTNVNNQIQSKLAEFKVLQDKYAEANQYTEGKTIPMNLIIGQNAERNRKLALEKNTMASEIGLLQAQASALQGNLTLAQKTADRATDLKYEDIKTVLDVKVEQLKLISDKLTRQEKFTADALDRQYKTQQSALAVTVANEKDKNVTLLNQMQTYPDAGITLNDTIEQANQKITTKSKIYADKITVKGTDIPKNTQLTQGLNQQLQSNNLIGQDGLVAWETYRDMLLTWVNNDGTESEFYLNYPTAKWLDAGNQAAYIKSVGTKPKAGDDFDNM